MLFADNEVDRRPRGLTRDMMQLLFPDLSGRDPQLGIKVEEYPLATLLLQPGGDLHDPAVVIAAVVDEDLVPNLDWVVNTHIWGSS